MIRQAHCNGSRRTVSLAVCGKGQKNACLCARLRGGGIVSPYFQNLIEERPRGSGLARTFFRIRLVLSTAGLLLAAAAVPGLAAPDLAAQSDSQTPLSFEVASIKPHAIPIGMSTFRFYNGTGPQAKGSLFSDRTATVQDLIIEAYGVEGYQILGLPAWAQAPGGEHYDIEARTPGQGTATTAQLRLMLQSLLAERFQLKLHRATKELPIYALTVAKGGTKLKEVPPDAPAEPKRAGPPDLTVPQTMRAPMGGIVSLVALFLDRPLLDHTGLRAAQYEFTWYASDLTAEVRASGKPAPSVFSAAQKQLGLKIDAQKEPLGVLIVDGVEATTVN